jgi:tetratricopeptide (TPR) repeat protein
MHRNNSIKSRLSLLQKIILIILGLILSLALLEIGLRLGGFIFLSLQEYRNRTAIYKKGTYRIMCLGESTTAIGGRDSYPSQLEEILNQRNLGINFSVINKGVVGNNTAYILAHLEENLNRYRPDMVTAMMGVNDKLIKYYEAIPEANTFLFNRFRTYRLSRLLWMHIINKIKKKGIYTQQGEKTAASLQSSYSLIRLRACYAEQVNPGQIEEAFKKAIELNPKDDRLYVELGRFYRDNGKYAQAEGLFQKSLNLNPRNDMAYVELGFCYLNQSKDIQAVQMLKKAVELNSRNDLAYVELGRYYRDQGKHIESEEALKKAIEINPRGDWAYILLGLCYMYQNKPTQAEEAFKKAIELNPTDDRAYGGLAALYEEMGKYESAQQCYQQANNLRLKHYDPRTIHNYKELKEISDKRGIKLVCIQYPVRSIEPLRRIFQGQDGVIFVDNEKVFKDALKKASYREYFTDMFEGDFGHCTRKGNRLLAENIANVILKECFNRR